MKIWVTKYWQELGVFEAETINCTPTYGLIIKTPEGQQGGELDQVYLFGGDWTHTKEEAIAQAEEMRARYVAMYSAELAALKALEFK